MQQIDKEVRSAVMNLIYAVMHVHPEVNEPRVVGATPKCDLCDRVAALMQLLDAEQREYGPPISVTDPSYIREFGMSEVSS